MVASRNEQTGRWTLDGVEPSEVTFERICKMLKQGINFKFARYGDGEFMCMAGKIGRNCDKHEYFADLGLALNDAFFSSPDYMVGIQPLSVHGGLYQRAVMDRPGPADIYDADVLHSASIDGKLEYFFDSIHDRTICIVGPTHLYELGHTHPNIFLGCQFVTIPDINCWEQYQRIALDLYCTLAHRKNIVVLLCASMMSEVLIDDFKDDNHTLIDCGSVFDPYVGKLSRRYHHKLQINGH